MSNPVPDGPPGSSDDVTAPYPGGATSWQAPEEATWPAAPTAPYPDSSGGQGWPGAPSDPYAALDPTTQPASPGPVRPAAGPAWQAGAAGPYALPQPAPGQVPCPPGPPGPAPAGQPPVVWVPQPVYYPPVDPRTTAKDWMGITSLVLGIVALVSLGYLGILTIPGVILGHMGRAAVRRGEASNGGMTLAGVIVNWVCLGLAAVGLLAVVLFWAVIASTSSTT